MAWSATDDYCFDVEGLLFLPGCFSDEAVGDVEALAGHPAMTERIQHLFTATGISNIVPNTMVNMGTDTQFGYRLDSIALLDAAVPAGTVPLFGGVPQPDGERLCMGVTATVCVADMPAGTGIVTVPGSHRSTLAEPQHVLDGTDTMDTTKTFTMKKGDLLICASTLLQSKPRQLRRQAQGGNSSASSATPAGFLARFEFAHSDSAPTASHSLPLADNSPEPEWMAALSPAQRAVVGMRTVGRAEVAVSDGSTTWTESRPPIDSPRGTPARQPPSLFIRDPDCLLDPAEACKPRCCYGRAVLQSDINTMSIYCIELTAGRVCVLSC